FQAEDGIRARTVTGVQTCALPILIFAFAPPWQNAQRASYSLAPSVRFAGVGSTGLPPAGLCLSAYSSIARLASARSIAPGGLSEIGRASCRERGGAVAEGGAGVAY